VVALTTTHMRALTTAELQAFTTDQIVAMETADLAALTMTQATAFTGTQLSAMSANQLDSLISTSPIVLDLDGNGVTTLAASAGVQFDLNATGHSSQVGWVGGNDGLLVMDRNHDGTINDGTELFGSATRLADGSRAGNGYAALAQMDSNHDGHISSQDAGFADLKLWVDANHDGKTDAGELHSLTELHITDLNLHASTGTAVDNGNLLALTSSYSTTDGASHDMADVWFRKDTTAASTPSVTVSDLLTAPSADVVLPTTTASAVAAPTDAHAAASTTAASDTSADHSTAQASAAVVGDAQVIDLHAALAVASATSSLFDENNKNLMI